MLDRTRYVPDSGRLGDRSDNTDAGWWHGTLEVAASAITALQPPRMVLGALAVAAIIVLGSIVDLIGGARLVVENDQPRAFGDADRAIVVERVQSALRAHVPALDRPTGWETSDVDAGGAVLALRAARVGAIEIDAADEARAIDESIEAIERARPRGFFDVLASRVRHSTGAFVTATLDVRPVDALDAVIDVVWRTPRAAWLASSGLTITTALAGAFVIALFGTSIARLEALQQLDGRRAGTTVAIGFARDHWRRAIEALLVPLAAAGLALGTIAVLGAALNWPIAELLGALLHGVAIVLAIAAAIMLLLYVVAVPLLIAAVAVEGVDGGDAMHRAYGLALARPGRLLAAGAFSLFAFAIGFALVQTLAVTALDLAGHASNAIVAGEAAGTAGGFAPLDLTFTKERTPVDGVSGVGAAIIGVWETVIIALVGGYAVAWLFTAGTRLFLLLRRDAEGQPFDAVARTGAISGTLIELPEPADARDPMRPTDDFAARR